MSLSRKSFRFAFFFATLVRRSTAFVPGRIAPLLYSLRHSIARKFASLNGSEDEDNLLQKYLQKAEQAAIEEFKQNEAPKWLQDMKSLPFECTACGKCCRTKGHVYLSPEETLQAASVLDISPQGFIDQYASHALSSNQTTWIRLREQDDACIFLDLDTNQCQIYEARPTQCRTYPFWPNILQSPDSWNAECRSKDDESNSPLPKWTAETGGCEGMERVDSHVEGVPIEDACQQLYQYIQDERRFPKGSEQ